MKIAEEIFITEDEKAQKIADEFRNNHENPLKDDNDDFNIEVQ
jgi:hypothetical protein